MRYVRPYTLRVTAAPESADLARVLQGQYTLEREIGRGGMGIVYLARDEMLHRPVAIKTLPPQLAGDPFVRERFLREARTAAALSHPNIVPIHRADEIDGQVFFVMGFVDGESLAERIRDRKRLDPREVVLELRDVALALDYAHHHGIVHRDVKAENILLDRASGRAVVTDFGIARVAEATPLTATGQVLGTVFYVSPEQVSGDPVDARSDVYSLGVVGYFALSGRFPFEATLASAVLVAHVTKTPSPLSSVAPDVPAPLASIVDRCLAREPGARFQSARQVADALIAAEPEVERACGADPKPPAAVLSEPEAEAIWQRAAELQALTGIQPRPVPTPRDRDFSADLARTSGYKLDAVREAAMEAGIAPQYVEHALAEHGLVRRDLAATGRAVSTRAEIRDISRPGKFGGAPWMVDFEIVIDGEVPSRDFDILGDVIQRTMGEVGTLSSVGRSLSWHGGGSVGGRHGNTVHVSIFPRAGKTTIRMSESLRPWIGATYGPILGAGGGGIGGSVFGSLMSHQGDPAIAIAAWAGVIGVAFVTARMAFRLLSRSRRRKLRDLAERLAAQVEESIADASGPSSSPRPQGASTEEFDRR